MGLVESTDWIHVAVVGGRRASNSGMFPAFGMQQPSHVKKLFIS